MLLTTLTALSLAALPLTAVPQEPDPIAKVRAAVDDTLSSINAPAILIAVARRDRVLLAEVRGKDVRPNALFPLGEASKVVSGMLLSRLAKDKVIALDAPLDRITKKWTLRDTSGEATNYTLAELLRGRAGLPRHYNFVTAKDAATWTTSRAIREHAVASGYVSGSHLNYALARHLIELGTERSWTAWMRSAVMKPLGIDDLAPDARAGLPATAVTLHTSGSFFKRAQPEPRCVSTLPSADGTWIGAKGLARILQELLRTAKGQVIRTLPKKRLAFQPMIWRERPFHHVYRSIRQPGARGGLAVFPDHDIAWAVLVNSSGSSGIPRRINAALEKHLLPKREEEDDGNRWNTSVGVGSNTPSFAQAHRGEWRGTFTFRGKEHRVTLWLGAKLPTHAKIDDGEKLAADGFHHEWRSRREFGLYGKGLFRARQDLDAGKFRFDLRHDRGRGVAIVGSFEVTDGHYYQLRFPIRLQKVKAAK